MNEEHKKIKAKKKQIRLEEKKQIRAEQKTQVSLEQKKQIWRMLLPQFIYIIAVFLPFIFMLAVTYDILDPFKSLSRIGWRTEVGGPGGWVYLTLFVFLSGPFMVYQVIFYLKHSIKKRGKFLLMLVICAAILMSVGAGIPFQHIARGGNKTLHFLHNAFAVLGGLLGILTVTLILIQVCRESRREIILLFYAFFCMIIYQGYQVLVNATAFEVGLVFVIFLFMFFINRYILYSAAKASNAKILNQFDTPA